MPPVTDEAICLRAWDWSETSQTLALLTQAHGLTRTIAKGSKRDKSPFGGPIEPLTRAEALFIPKGPGHLATLTAWDLRERFSAPRRSLAAFNASLYLVDLILHMLTDADPHPRVFDALTSALRAMEGPAHIIPAVVAFQWSLLDEAGYRPELDRDMRSGAPLPHQPTYRFDPRLGGVVSDDNPGGDLGWRMRDETLNLLRSLRSLDPSPLIAVLAASPAAARANRFLAAYAREIIGEEVPTYRTLFPSRDH